MKHLIALLFVASLWGQTSGVTTSGNIRSGSGSPEGSVSAPVGTVYQRTDGSTGTSLYIKESGSGNTGWVAVAASAGGSGTFKSIITDLKVTYVSGTRIDIAGGDCFGSTKPDMNLQISGTSGAGSVEIYCTDTGEVVAEYTSGLGGTWTASGLPDFTPSPVGTPGVPDGQRHLATVTVSSGAFQDSVVDHRSWSIKHRAVEGNGMSISCADDVCTYSIDAAIVQRKADAYTPVDEFNCTGCTKSRPFEARTSDRSCSAGTDDGVTWYRTDTDVTKQCQQGSVATLGGSSTPTITNNVYWPFGPPAQTTSTLNPGSTVVRAYKFTVVGASYTFTKLRYVTSGNTGYVGWAIYDATGSAKVTNATAACNNASVGGGTAIECSWAGSVTLSAGTTYYLAFAADASNGITVGNDVAGLIGYANGTGFGSYFGQSSNSSSSSGSGITLPSSLGTVSAITGSIAGNQPPAVVFIP